MEEVKKRIFYRKALVMQVFCLFGLVSFVGLFFMLEGATVQVMAQEKVNTDVLPDILVKEEKGEESKLTAFMRANAMMEQEARERKLQEEHNSFDFFTKQLETPESQLERDERALAETEKEGAQALAALERARREEVVVESENEKKRVAASKATRGEEDSYKGKRKITHGDDEVELSIEERKEMEKRKKRERINEIMGVGKGNDENKGQAVKQEDKVVAENTDKEVSGQKGGKRGFQSLNGGTSKVTKGSVRAVIHGEQKNITTSSQVKIRLIDPIEVGGVTIPRNTLVIGKAKFSENRVNVSIDNISYNDNVYPFEGTIYDQGDGGKGIYIPDNLVDEATKETASNTISQTETKVNVATLSGVINTGANAAIDATKRLSSNRAKETKVTLPANYKLLIKTK